MPCTRPTTSLKSPSPERRFATWAAVGLLLASCGEQPLPVELRPRGVEAEYEVSIRPAGDGHTLGSEGILRGPYSWEVPASSDPPWEEISDVAIVHDSLLLALDRRAGLVRSVDLRSGRAEPTPMPLSSGQDIRALASSGTQVLYALRSGTVVEHDLVDGGESIQWQGQDVVASLCTNGSLWLRHTPRVDSGNVVSVAARDMGDAWSIPNPWYSSDPILGLYLSYSLAECTAAGRVILGTALGSSVILFGEDGRAEAILDFPDVPMVKLYQTTDGFRQTRSSSEYLLDNLLALGDTAVVIQFRERQIYDEIRKAEVMAERWQTYVIDLRTRQGEFLGYSPGKVVYMSDATEVVVLQISFPEPRLFARRFTR